MERLVKLAANLGTELLKRKYKIAVAESCTGGLIAAAITSISGSSQWFDRGFVTYSNLAKSQMLGINAELISKYGAVSEEVAIAMAVGALKNSDAQVTLAVTGIAGPGGGTIEKPVGSVWTAHNFQGKLSTQFFNFIGDREQIREQATMEVLQRALDLIRSSNNSL